MYEFMGVTLLLFGGKCLLFSVNFSSAWMTHIRVDFARRRSRRLAYSRNNVTMNEVNIQRGPKKVNHYRIIKNRFKSY